MKNIIGSALAAGALAALIASSTPAYAQSEFGPTGYQAFIGRDPGMGPKCPPVSYHIVAKTKNQLEGMAYTSAGDGMELYAVTGTLGADGKVSMDLKPVGVGTPTKVEGVYKNSMLMIKRSGGLCHVDDFMMMPVVVPQAVSSSEG